METKMVEAIGNFLQFYYSDLRYILNFQRFKLNENQIFDQAKKDPETIKSFIDEFQVARTFKKIETNNLIKLTFNWIKRKDCDDVDKFSLKLRDHNITRGSIPLSLASKLLFLNNPWYLFPLDARSKRTLGLKTKDYASFIDQVHEYKSKNDKLVEDILTYLRPYWLEIEKEYQKQLFKIELIRENRLIDKILWVYGEK